MLSGIGTIGGGVAILIAALIGGNAATNFRTQKRTEREMEFAERASAVAYKLESALDAIRSPFSSAAELQASEDELSELEWFKSSANEKKQQIIQANVFYQRMRHFEDDFDEASSLIPFLRAYFGDSAGEAMRDIIHARHTVRVYAEAYADDNHQDSEHTKTIRENIWRSFSESKADPVRTKVEESVKKLEAVLTPLLRAKADRTLSIEPQKGPS